MIRYPAALAVVLLSACSLIDPSPWHSRYDRDHALVGRFWDVRQERFTDWPALMADVSSATFVLVGEDHENRDHHEFQARVLAALVAAGRGPALAMEMLDSGQQAGADSCAASGVCDQATFGRMVAWEKHGWPSWRWYAPIVEVALSNGMPVLAANLPRAKIRSITRAGGLSEEEARRLPTALAPLEEPLERSLEEEIRASHCHHAPEAMVSKMALAQRVRDAQMAQVLSRHADTGVVLIAGNGHVRNDRAVPLHLALAGSKQRVVSIGTVDVRAELSAPQDYAPLMHAEALPFDYVWFSPRASNKDPCERFRKQLEQMGKNRKHGRGASDE